MNKKRILALLLSVLLLEAAVVPGTLATEFVDESDTSEFVAAEVPAPVVEAAPVVEEVYVEAAPAAEEAIYTEPAADQTAEIVETAEEVTIDETAEELSDESDEIVETIDETEDEITEDTEDTEDETEEEDTDEAAGEQPVFETRTIRKVTDDGKYSVTVTGDMPADAQITLAPVDDAIAETVLENAEIEGTITAYFAVDITITDGAGNIWQPEELGATVRVAGLDAANADDVGVIHVLDDVDTLLQSETAQKLEDEQVAEALEAAAEAAMEAYGDEDTVYYEAMTQADEAVTVVSSTVRIDTDSFSTFVVYTVDFYYGDEEYHMEGGSSMYLSTLFEELGIERDVVMVESVTFSDPELLEIMKEGDNWLLTSLAPFESDELLTVVFYSGETIEIDVADQQTTSSMNFNQANYYFSTSIADFTGTNYYYYGVLSSASYTAPAVGFTGIGGGTVTANTTFHIDSNNVPISGTVTVNNGATLTIVTGGNATLYATAKTCGKEEHTHSSMPTTETHWRTTDTKPNRVANVGDVIGCWKCTKSDYEHAFLSTHYYYKYSWERVCGKEEHTHSSSCYTCQSRSVTSSYNAASPALVRADGFTGYLFNIQPGGRVVIQAANGSQFIIDGRNVSAGSALIHCNGSMTLTNVTLRNAVSSGDGGGILANGGSDSRATIALTNCVFDNLTAGAGSAIFLAGGSNANTTLAGCTVQNCKTTDRLGGTIRTNGSTKGVLTVDGGTFKNNYSSGHGGAIYWNAAGDATTRMIIKGNCRMEGNTAADKGGAIMVETAMDLQSATITGNSATSGGGLYLSTYRGGAGGYSGDGIQLAVSSAVTITNNTASELGGGVYMYICASSDIDLAGGATFYLRVNGATISGNSATNGGGVAIEDTAPARNDLTSFTRSVTVSGGSISNNTASANGGAIYIEKRDQAADGTANPNPTLGGTMTVTVSNGTLTGNKANGGSGGAIYIKNTSTNGAAPMSIGGGTIKTNTASENGGAIYVEGTGATVTVAEGTVESNTATKDGGAFYVTGRDAQVAVKGGSVSKNTAEGGYGGAFSVWGDGSRVSVENGKVDENTASSVGGGFYTFGGTVTVTGGEIKQNTATSGGGIYTVGGNITVIGGTIEGNTASSLGGGIGGFGSDVTISGGTIKGNSAGSGGGIHMSCTSSSATLKVTNGLITENRATSGGGVYCDNAASGANVTCTVLITNGTISNNSASSNGGGLYCKNSSTASGSVSTISVSNGTISGNTAGSFGGGIYSSKSTVNISGNGAITGNSAKNGGGVYIADNGTINVTGGILTGNRAEGTPAGKTAKANAANRGVGGGVYVNKGVFNMQAASGSGVGVYGNTADFAAADAYTSGSGTQLTIPGVTGMDLTGFDGQATGWYEDFANGDTGYASLANDGMTHAAVRYAEARNTVEVPAVTNDTRFICMTIGAARSGYGQLTIVKDVAEYDPNQTFVFRVVGTSDAGDNVDLRIPVIGANSITIYDIPHGTYTVTEDLSWAWRYTSSDSSQTVTVSSTSISPSVTIHNTKTTSAGLSALDDVVNDYRKVG